MPIDTNDAFESVKFNYRNERDAEFVLSLEFHRTEEYGETITIHNLMTGALSLPASAFGDAVDYLRGKGHLGGSIAPSAIPVIGGGVNRPMQSKLTPTRVAGAVVRTPTAGSQVTPPQMGRVGTPQPADQMNIGGPVGGYIEQSHILMSSTGAAESFSAPRPPKAKPARPVAPPPEIEDSEDEGIDPAFTFAAAKAKRQELANSDRAPKRIGRVIKEGEPGYEKWLAQQDG